MGGTTLETLPTGPAHDGNDLGFWEGLRAGDLRLPRCASCGTWRTVGRPLCAGCWSFDTSWERIEPRGSVFSWARTQRPFMSELDVEVPYVSVVVQLDDVPVRLLGILVGLDGTPRIGDRLVGEVQHPANAEWPVLRWRREVAA
ncbi:Zn-ribbon domain-containing OB-fold protein [Nocardioides sp. SYSU DS0651]|uniref:Zn-ribbon domain-containing OB-fold protein n=1 Tax=Nocardioides sp. SYSU DS0651 TaxID=3415955 RepID=UPI003F4C2FFB